MSKASPGLYRVAGVMLPSDQTTRLNDLGLRVGMTVNVLQNLGESGVVVACGDARLALDSGTTGKILLAPAAGE